MSIINDALKKTDRLIKKSSNLPGADIMAAHRPKKKNYLIFALAVIAGLIIGNTALNYFSRSAKPPEIKVSGISAVPPANAALPAQKAVAVEPAAPEPAPEAKKPAVPDFILSGIFFSDSGGYALINNQIVKRGDTVKGATVLSVSLDTVKLDAAGQLIVLTTENK